MLDVTDCPLPASQVTTWMQRLCARFRGDGIVSIIEVDGATEPVTVEVAGEEVRQWRM